MAFFTLFEEVFTLFEEVFTLSDSVWKFLPCLRKFLPCLRKFLPCHFLKILENMPICMGKLACTFPDGDGTFCLVCDDIYLVR
jgi:hypothetical protein